MLQAVTTASLVQPALDLEQCILRLAPAWVLDQFELCKLELRPFELRQSKNK